MIDGTIVIKNFFPFCIDLYSRALNVTLLRNFPHYSRPQAFILAEQSLTIRLRSIKCKVQSDALIPKNIPYPSRNITSRFQARAQQVSHSTNFRNNKLVEA